MLSSDQHTKGQWYTPLVLYFMGIQSYKATWKGEKTKQGELGNSDTERHTITNRAILPPNTHLHSWKAAQKADQFTIHHFQNLFEQCSTQGCQK